MCRRRPLIALAALLIAGLLPVAAAPAVTSAATSGITVVVPATAQRDRLTAITLLLPPGTAAVDGRVLFPDGSAELMGVAPLRGGTGVAPVEFRGGAWFGAYGLRPMRGPVPVQLVLLPRHGGSLDVRVVVDTVADRRGRRSSARLDTMRRLAVAGRTSRAAAGPARASALDRGQPQGSLVEAVPDGRINARDVDFARLEWQTARETGRVCGRPAGDLDGDGCADIADVQTTVAQVGTATDNAGSPPAPRAPGRVVRAAGPTRPKLLADGTSVWTVRSVADTPDATRGDGLCADSRGRCTLRAAIMEADFLRGDDRITFDLAGTAPVTIALTGRLPIITSRVGTIDIDGTTQTGARVNDARYLSNAIPGVELRGNGAAAREVGLRITSAGNTVRGLAMRELWRGVMLDGPGATGNRIVGNWIGITGGGAAQTSFGDVGVLLNTGANGNRVGSPDLADRNVIGAWFDGINSYGPGTNGNVIQNNLVCLRPGGGGAPCYVAIDHNYGPKENLAGGAGALQGNVTGPTQLQGIEYSHGWDPKGVDTTTTWQINGNRAIGNWVGFRPTGRYDAAYRPGYRNRANGQGINVYDGANDNLVEGNWVSSTWDGIVVETKNSRRNVVRGNIIGVSPEGDAAPMQGWGIVVRGATREDRIVGNLIRNAAAGGIGLTNLNAAFTAAQAPARQITLSRNLVWDTAGPSIDLMGRSGPDPNDPGDADDGANSVLNTPVITMADTARVRGTALPGATVEVFKANRSAGAFGHPVAFLGDTVTTSDGTWALPIDGLAIGDRVTATQTRGDGTTSELSVNVLVGTGPAAGDPVALDGFERTAAEGWGTADLGGTWTLTGTLFSVAGGVGRVVTPAATGREARLSAGVADQRVLATFAVDPLPVGGSAFGYLLARAGSGRSERVAVRIAPSGAVFLRLLSIVDRVETAISPEVSTGLVVAAGQPIRVRLEVVGESRAARAWLPGSGEPDAWLVTADGARAGGASGVGVAAYTGRNVVNGPITLTVDDFAARRGS